MTLHHVKPAMMDKSHKPKAMGLWVVRLAVLFSLVCLVATTVMLVSRL